MIYYVGRDLGFAKVNGVIFAATHCDTKLGYAVVFKRDQAGMLCLNNERTRLLKEVIRGRVEFERWK